MNILTTSTPITKVRVHLRPRKPASSATVILALADVTVADLVVLTGFSLRTREGGEFWIKFPYRKRNQLCRECGGTCPYDSLYCPSCGVPGPIRGHNPHVRDEFRNILPSCPASRDAITEAVVRAYLICLTRR